MEQIYVTISGKEYPICFSIGAMEAFIGRYGSIEGAGNVFNENDYLKALKEIRWMLSVLVEQGCKKAAFESGSSINYPSEEQLEFLISTADIRDFEEKIVEAIKTGNETEIEVEEDVKNAMTT